MVENNDQPLEALADGIYHAVRARLDGREPEVSLLSPGGTRWPRPTLANLDAAFYAALDEVLGREPGLGVFLLTGIPGPAAHARRLSFADRMPSLVARSLTGLFDEQAWSLRMLLQLVAPGDVLQSVGLDASPESMALREKLFDAAPKLAVAGLKGIGRAQAWTLRERALLRRPPRGGPVRTDGVDSAPAWELRRQGVRDGLVGGDGEEPHRTHRRGGGRDAGPSLPARSAGGAAERDRPDTPRWRRRIREQLCGQALKVVMRTPHRRRCAVRMGDAPRGGGALEGGAGRSTGWTSKRRGRCARSTGASGRRRRSRRCGTSRSPAAAKR